MKQKDVKVNEDIADSCQRNFLLQRAVGSCLQMLTATRFSTGIAFLNDVPILLILGASKATS